MSSDSNAINYPEENIQHTEQDESLKSRRFTLHVFRLKRYEPLCCRSFLRKNHKLRELTKCK